MALVLFIITLVFICIAFFPIQPLGTFQNPFVLYLIHEGEFFYTYWKASVFLFLVFVVLLSRAPHHRKHPVKRRFIFSFIHSLQVTVMCFMFAFVTLFFIAFLHLNSVALVMNSNPQILGITRDTNEIIRKLKTANRTPEIIITETDKEVFAIAAAAAGKETFYGRYILSAIPKFFVWPVQHQKESIFLVNNTVVITAVLPVDVHRINPIIANLLIKHYFWGRHIKSFPQVSLMDKDEYSVYRADDAKKKVAKIDETIQQVLGAVSNSNTAIENNKNTITQIQNFLNNATELRDSEYKQCLAARSAQRDCNDILNQSNKAVKQGKLDISESNLQIQSLQKQRAIYQDSENFFKTQKERLQTVGENIPLESGNFEPPDTIKIAYDTKNPNPVADYFAIVIHEYLHYASYISEEQKLTDLFFEEGLTEYFTRRVTNKSFDTEINISYPAHAKIISEMTKMITESELAEIYFTKDQEALEKALDRVYGDGFYKKNQIVFESLQYTTDRKEVIKHANSIMSQIGGTPLMEGELVSPRNSL